MTTLARQLIEYMRQRRNPRAVGAGDIRDPRLLAELFEEIFDERLQLARPKAVPARMVMVSTGFETAPEIPAPDFDCERADEPDRKEALLLGYLEDALGGSKVKAA